MHLFLNFVNPLPLNKMKASQTIALVHTSNHKVNVTISNIDPVSNVDNQEVV
jgi:hypothetical protein